MHSSFHFYPGAPLLFRVPCSQHELTHELTVRLQCSTYRRVCIRKHCLRWREAHADKDKF